MIQVSSADGDDDTGSEIEPEKLDPDGEAYQLPSAIAGVVELNAVWEIQWTVRVYCLTTNLLSSRSTTANISSIELLFSMVRSITEFTQAVSDLCNLLI